LKAKKDQENQKQQNKREENKNRKKQLHIYTQKRTKSKLLMK
jgi:hypothetical protein